MTNTTEDRISKISELKEELKVLREIELKGKVLRARAQNYVDFEKPTKFFCNLEKQNYVNKVVNRVQTSNGTITNQEMILKELKTFYKNLLQSNNKSNQRPIDNPFLEKKNIKKLSIYDQMKCEGLITEKEVCNVLKNMKNGKSPGTDGYTAEFYKFFWKDIGQFVMESLNESFFTGELSITQKQGLISLLPKGNKPRDLIKNWRPITLLNVDYKLLAGVLAYRVKEVLPNIIQSEQKGFLKGRYIGENIRTVADTLNFIKQKQLTGMLLLIDFEKAFDSLEWDYLGSVLKAYNFGKDFRKWFTILYKNSSSCVINNGFFTEFFKIERSCRQGDPLSPYLFILAVEPLAAAIRNSDKIKGISVGDREVKIGQYADDTFLFLNGTSMSINESFHVISLFYNFSGLKINIEKTQAVWLGKEKDRERVQTHYKLQWVEQFLLLGILFHTKQEKMLLLNFNKKINEIDKVLNMYSKFKLSLIGRISVIKTLALPKLVYLFTVLPTPPTSILGRIEKIFKDFLWKKSTVKISNSQLEKDISEGGLKLINMVNFNRSLKLTWLKRLVTTNGSWQNIFEVSIADSLPAKTFLELDKKSLAEVIDLCPNVFWKEVLQIWCTFKIKFSDNIDSRKYPLWGTYFMKNSNLRRRAKEMISKGVIHINDMLSNTGQTLGYYDFMEKYNIQLNFVDFYSLTHVIPRNWLRGFNATLNQREMEQGWLAKLVQQKYPSKWVYKKLASLVEYSRGHEAKWANILEIDIPESDWSKYYLNNHHSTVKVSLRDFQYQILTRIIPTNRFLAKCKLTPSDKCWFCKESIETIEHLFWLCPVVKTFWFQLLEILNTNVEIRSFLNDKNVLLGVTEGENKDSLNFLFTVVKKYIYITKCNENLLSVISCKGLLKYHFTMEQYAIKNNLISANSSVSRIEILSSVFTQV